MPQLVNYIKRQVQEKGSLVDTTQFKATQTIKRQEFEEMIEDDLEFDEVNKPEDSITPESKVDQKQQPIKTEKTIDEDIDDFDEEDFDEEDDDFDIEQEFESVKSQKRAPAQKVSMKKKLKDNLTPPDYSKIVQELKIKIWYKNKVN